MGQKVQLCVDLADVLLSNEAQFNEPRDKEDFFKVLDDYVTLMRTPGSRKPSPAELNMGQAYAASLMSTCCKRKVGAVLVREVRHEDRGEETLQSYILASGYNEAPLGIKRCVDRGGTTQPLFCVKDEKTRKVLRKQYQHCPKCGSQINFPEGQFALPLTCSNSNCNAFLGREFVPGRMLDLCIAVHAEEAAILQAARFGQAEIQGSVLYTTTFPCPLCAKKIVACGIKKFYFAEPYPGDEATDILAEASVDQFLFVGVKGRAYFRLFEAAQEV